MSSQLLFFISKVSDGAIWIGPCPQIEKLSQWVNALKQENIAHVVSLLEETESERHELETEGAVLEQHGISFARFPVDDFSTPDAAKFPDLIEDLSTRVTRGEVLFLHCAGGVGRAGTTASCLLVKHGMDPDVAMALVSDKRGVQSPETPDQVNFVRAFQA